MSKAARTALDALCLLMPPAALAACALLHLQASALLTLLSAAVALGIFFLGWERSQPGLWQLMPTAVMIAAAVTGRIIFAAAPNIQPVTALCIIAGAIFGKRAGFLTGAMTGLVSSFFLGLGAWTPWQMYAWGLVGYVAGALFGGVGSVHRGKGCAAAAMAFGFAASFAFGFVMNTWTLVGFTGALNWGSALAVYGAGFVFDLAHALSTAAFLGILYVPLGKKLGRIAVKYDLIDASSAKARA